MKKYGKWELRYACDHCKLVIGCYYSCVISVCPECGTRDVKAVPVVARRVATYRWFRSPIYTWEVKESEAK